MLHIIVKTCNNTYKNPMLHIIVKTCNNTYKNLRLHIIVKTCNNTCNIIVKTYLQKSYVAYNCKDM